jgi:transcriptional regulator GlxA family with amidase domain
VTKVRVTAARELQETGDAAPKQVAGRCGFADVDTLRRVFVRRVGVTLAEYRKRYGGMGEEWWKWGCQR